MTILVRRFGVSLRTTGCGASSKAPGVVPLRDEGHCHPCPAQNTVQGRIVTRIERPAPVLGRASAGGQLQIGALICSPQSRAGPTQKSGSIVRTDTHQGPDAARRQT